MKFKFDERLKSIFIRNFIFSLAGLLLLITVIILPLSRSMVDLHEEKVTNINENLCTRSKDSVETILKEIEMYVVSLSIDTDVKAYISSNKYSETLANRIQENIRFYKNINDYINYVGLYNDKTGYLLSENEATISGRPDMYDKLNEGDAKTDVQAMAKNGKYPFVIELSRKITIAGNTGVIIADINVDKLNKLFNRFESEETDKFYITDNQGKIIYSTSLTDDFGKNFKDIAEGTGEEVEKDSIRYVKTEIASEEYGMQFISLMPVASYSIFLTPLWKMIFFILLMCMVTALIYVYWLSRMSVQPVDQILVSIEQAENPEKKIPAQIQYIVDDIIGAVNRSQNGNGDDGMKKLLMKFAHVQVMESQMNPHFLYNALDSINWLAFRGMGKDNPISEYVEDLSEVFRLGLRNENYLIPFKEELSHAKAFSRLLSRYNEMLSIDFDIHKETENLCCIQFILQPMIENAMYHGIKPSGRQGTINVKAFCTDKRFIIEVTDNGKGMTDEKIARINETLASGLGEAEEELKKVIISWHSQTELKSIQGQRSWWLERKTNDIGIGIKNVNNRIKILFGDEYGLSITKNKDEGITITINMPKISWEEHGNN